ncbi:radical SAM protein [Anaerofilum sp. BX8]|uniref:Radical SAM protein n=1 Tax=Anaerofilum hominis TaxID=2763016 RepID=A0A923L0F4_9FIRM|nr:radical SAM protein [Anaerofilum hominis]
MRARHRNLPFFIPHAGCPHRCSFCDQNSISGAAAGPSPAQVAESCAALLPPAGEGCGVEIAFFGGSFTAVDAGYRRALLAAAAPFVEAGRAAGIRVSTRPDAVDAAVLAELRRYGVTAVELGAQSMNDTVLRLNGRGHTSLQTRFAAQLVKNSGFSLGLQMMVGLFGEYDPARAARDTAIALANLGPDTVRIYPTLVLRGTPLAELARQGSYRPLTVEQAVEATAPLIELFERKGVRVIRVGLQDDGPLRQNLVAGPYHPAFRQLCEARLYRQAAEAALRGLPAGRYLLSVPPGGHSAAAGQRRENLRYFSERGYELAVREEPALSGRQIGLRAL